MPLLLLLLLSSAESNNNNEETEEAVTEYSSAFINVSWVELDRQVKAGEPKYLFTNWRRFYTRRRARQGAILWQGQPQCRQRQSCLATQPTTWKSTLAAPRSMLLQRSPLLRSCSAAAASLT